MLEARALRLNPNLYLLPRRSQLLIHVHTACRYLIDPTYMACSVVVSFGTVVTLSILFAMYWAMKVKDRFIGTFLQFGVAAHQSENLAGLVINLGHDSHKNPNRI